MPRRAVAGSTLLFRIRMVPAEMRVEVFVASAANDEVGRELTARVDRNAAAAESHRTAELECRRQV